jgi:microcystin degradation protein MlrC
MTPTMRLFTAQLVNETNTFAPIPTGVSAYEEMGIHHGTASRDDPDGLFTVLAEWRRLSVADGYEVIEGLAAIAQPGGRTVRALYEDFRGEILQKISDALPLDAVLLNLHGAMAADGYDDCEGDLLTRIRRIVGDRVPIGIEIDLHCHLTEAMVGATDLIVAYKEYPHTDMLERAREVYRLTLAAAKGEIKPRLSVSDCRMVGLWHTATPLMRQFVDEMQRMERDAGVLSVSFGHGFPWADVPEAGAKTWVITDSRPDLGAKLARTLTGWLWQNREATRTPLVDIDGALDIVQAAGNFPIVLADGADNAGGGAPSDSTFILERAIERGMGDMALGFLYDPGAVNICREAGVGSRLDLRIGGKLSKSSGRPLDLSVTVRSIIEAHTQHGLGLVWPLGASARVETDERIDIVLTSVRTQALDPEAFTKLGVPLSDKRMIVVKSIQHFHAKFGPLASQVVYVAAPGALDRRFEALPYTKRSLNYWPRAADPWARNT